MSFLAFSFVLYFLPAVIASSRSHSSSVAIWVVNLLFGWTGVGWLLCLAWALSAPRPLVFYAAAPYPMAVPAAAPGSWGSLSLQRSPELRCAACQRPVPPNARYCSMCGATGTSWR